MVAVGMALMPRPRLMMMDEPSIGLAPVLVQRVLGVVDVEDLAILEPSVERIIASFYEERS